MSQSPVVSFNFVFVLISCLVFFLPIDENCRSRVKSKQSFMTVRESTVVDPSQLYIRTRKIDSFEIGKI